MPRITAEQRKQQAAKSQLEPATKEPEPAKSVQIIERRIERVTVEVPLGEPPHPFHELHVEGWLRGETANTFAKIRQALKDLGSKTKDGRPVKTNPDILRWLMEQVETPDPA